MTAPTITHTVRQSYRFALDPNAHTREVLASHSGAARFAYNWALSAVKANLGQREAERSYGIADADLTPPLGWSLPALRKRWLAVKREVAPWWGENSKEAYDTGLRRLAVALQNWKDSKTGKRTGKRVGFPRYKSKGRAKDSIQFTTGTIRVTDDNRHVVLPRLGKIRIFESARKLTRRAIAGTARITSATVTRQAGRWYVSFAVEVQRQIPTGPSPQQAARGAVGVDVGLSAYATLSRTVKGLTNKHGTIANPKYLNKALRKLAQAQRALSRCERGSKRRSKARGRLAKQHAKIANQRADFQHKVSTALARTFAAIGLETLGIADMLGNHHLSRAISDASWGSFRTKVEYKTVWYGSHTVLADRFYPSSKKCSQCGAVKAKLLLNERVFRCDDCGFQIGRDSNASRNLEDVAREQLAASP